MGSLLVGALPLGSLSLQVVDPLPLGLLSSARFDWLGWEAWSRRSAARRCLYTFTKRYSSLRCGRPTRPEPGLSAPRSAPWIHDLPFSTVVEIEIGDHSREAANAK